MNQIKRQLSFIQPVDTETKKLCNKLHLLPKLSRNGLENLSNELFYEIFDYLDGCDVYNAFSNLNIRFQNLISCSSLSLKIDLGAKSKSTLEHRCRHLIIPNRHRILSFHLTDKSLIDEFFKYCTIDSSFHRLESIFLGGIPIIKLLMTLLYLNFLPRLSSLTVSVFSGEEYDYNLGDIYRLIFSLSNLKYSKLSLFSYEELDIVVPVRINEKFSTIEYLVIRHFCTLNQLISLLHHTPRVCHLTCELLSESDENVRKGVPITLSHLTHISIGACSVEFDEFEAFIKNISSQLQVLHISVSWNTAYLDGNRWEKLIKKYMPHLDKFYFNYDQYIHDDFSEDPGFTFINQFTSPFWLERNWFCELKVDRNSMTFLIHPYKKEWFDFYELMENRQKSDNRSIQLTVEGHISTERTQPFIEKMKSSCVAVRFTHLNISYDGMPIGMLIEIIRLLPNLESLRLSSLPSLQLGSLSVEDTKKHLLVSLINKIKKVKLDKVTDVKEIQFLINLCLHMQYFELDCMANTDSETLIKFIFMKQMTKIPNLNSLCLNVHNANEKMIQKFATVIDLETFLNDYTIERIGDKILLQWKVQ